MDPSVWSESVETSIVSWISAAKVILNNLLPDHEQDDKIIQFLDDRSFYFLIKILDNKMLENNIPTIDLNALQARLDILKRNKKWNWITHDVSYLVSQIKGGANPRAVYEQTAALLNAIASIPLRSNLTPINGTSSAENVTSLSQQLQNLGINQSSTFCEAQNGYRGRYS